LDLLAVLTFERISLDCRKPWSLQENGLIRSPPIRDDLEPIVPLLPNDPLGLNILSKFLHPKVCRNLPGRDGLTTIFLRLQFSLKGRSQPSLSLPAEILRFQFSLKSRSQQSLSLPAAILRFQFSLKSRSQQSLSLPAAIFSLLHLSICSSLETLLSR
jgi:hypothetical protein